ncbi:PcfJ-like protein [Schinkia azotoformans MEV2011]|uniref:PcfJ-like protein n=1 Tax=Schinkia azotoformans MEV2011 TaxID=1348973 RepID=A0A072P4M6_SCHAZ|nr:PcfJ domain-containing protein [Schinkia azotoformans]KEF40440.1 PcfJ-like protein [Schinkia azotoformans MEV2011]MEC1696150.1 PcfJ domain-containing protein [Schinkia azotoformans]MEC1725347.1 PcfJ domain-containing protein [Schinkia azotoformans]MEC1779458.1 PcfJ domain-containing protein [Schinkia azotoformans]MED4330057.1 PcfJ domain-containing protein [Schinkia azotoformans]
MKLEKSELDEILAHFPEKINQAMVDYVTDVVLLSSRYIFTKRSGSGQQYGYCTHCKKTFKTPNLKHNENTSCLECQSICTVKASGRGRKYLQDRGYFVWYEKSLVNSIAITARGIEVYRDYSGDYKKVQTDFHVTAIYLFEPGKTLMIDRYYWNSSWRKRKSIISESNTSKKNIRCYYSRESIAEAVKGTLFQYSTWEKFDHNELLEFFDLAAKYPCIEYLSKLGLTNLIKDKLVGRKTYSAINWRGKTLDKVLKLPKQEIKAIRDSKISVSYFSLYLYHQSKKDGSNLDLKEAVHLSHLVEPFREDDLKVLQNYTTMRKIYSYIKKQYANKNKKHYYHAPQVIGTWKDYIADCKKLEMDITQESILFPTYLYKAHQDTIKKIKYKEDQELNELIAKRLKVLNSYSFEYKGFFIRPVISTKELIDEGNALSHCVGGYAKQYAKGGTDIFVIRKVSEPDKPFYTVEIRNNVIYQAYGFKNELPTKDVQAFIDAFTKAKLTKRSKGRKVAV